MSQQAADNVNRPHGGKINYVIVGLLAGILATQVIMLQRMPASPPTAGTLKNATTAEARVKLLQRIPVVCVQGGTIDDITRTVDVNVGNTPL